MTLLGPEVLELLGEQGVRRCRCVIACGAARSARPPSRSPRPRRRRPPAPTRRPCGSPARTSAAGATRVAGARCGWSCWRCWLVAVVAASVWVVFFSSFVTARDVTVDRHRRRSATAASSARPTYPTGTPLARVDLDAIRARVEAIAGRQEGRGLAQLAAHRAHRRHRAHPDRRRRPAATASRALDDRGRPLRPLRQPPQAAAARDRTEPDTADEALVEGGRVIGSLPAGIASRVDTVEVASVDKIQLVLRQRPPGAVGERRRLRPEGRGARRTPAPAGPADRRLRPGASHHP